MVDKPHTKKNADHTQNSTEQMLFPDPENNIENEEEDSDQQEYEFTHKHKVSLRGRWKRTATYNKFIAVAAVVSAASTLAYAIFAMLQWGAMNAQLAEIKKGSSDTHELAVQAKNQADRTKDVADNALIQANATNALAKEAKRSAELSAKNLNLARDSMQLEQRPWVGVTNYACECTEANGTLKISKLDLWYSNSGKTPAIKMSGKFIFVIRRWSEPIPSFDEEDARQRREFTDNMKKLPSELRKVIEKDTERMSGRFYPEGGALAPNVVNHRILGSGNTFGRDPSIDIRGPDRQIVYALGKITYYDTLSSRKHTTTFCLSEDPMNQPSTAFSFCAKGQNMD